MQQIKPRAVAVVRKIQERKFLAEIEADGERIVGDPGDTPEHAVHDLLVTLACRGLPVDVGLSIQ